MPGKRYKDYRFYAYVALNLMASRLDIDIFQKDLSQKLPAVLIRPDIWVSKSEIMHEIKSNHNMTNKVLGYILDEGLAAEERQERAFKYTITADGIDYLRQYSSFFNQLFQKELREHYRYGRGPGWAEKAQ